MYFKREKEFQYLPGIEKIIEGVRGGGMIARDDMYGAAFGGIQLDELPPFVIVGKGITGAYHVVKTAKIQAVAADLSTQYKVKKNHVFVLGDAVTLGCNLNKAADKITAIDKLNTGYDVLTLAGTIGDAAVDDVIVLVNDVAVAGSVTFKYEPEFITMDPVSLTGANQSCGLLVIGTVNEVVMSFPVDAALKNIMRRIRFV